MHVAVIMDGNGRWATRQCLPRLAGHQAGAEALREVVRAAPDLGIGVLTAYAFSADNWKRSPGEVAGLMTLLAWYLDGESRRLAASDVQLEVIGRRDRLPEALLGAVGRAESATAHCEGLRLRLAIDYSSREAILRASQAGRFEEMLGRTPAVDLLIRTGGEQRLSDFLLWECAYAELFFTRRMWPEFGERDLGEAVREFRKRQRRFGAAPAAAPVPATRERWLR